MKNKTHYLLAGLLLVATTYVGCKKDDDDDNGGGYPGTSPDSNCQF